MGLQFLRQRNQAAALASEGVVTQGQILRVDTIRPVLFHYSYSVSGHHYEGAAGAPGRNYLEKGDIVQVHYLPSNPSVSGLNAEEEIRNDNQGLLFISVFLSMVCLMFFGVFVAIRRGITFGST